MAQEHSEIREEIDRTRENLAEKATELSERASAAAQKIKLSYQIEQRPFAMVAASLAAGFVAQRLLFPRRPAPNVFLVSEEDLERAPRRFKRRVVDLRDDDVGEEETEEMEFDGGRRRSSIWESEPVKALTMAGQMAATTLVREVAERLIGRVKAARSEHSTETLHH